MAAATAEKPPAAGAEQQQPAPKPTWQSEAYATYRPTYPPALYDAIMAKHTGGRALAVDIGCGTGQVTADLAPRFDQVVGIDASTSQLAQARRAPNVAYQQGTAEATGLADGCADLITVAAALHWFDLPAFYREARRILRGDGTLAAWSYMGWQLGHPGAQAVYDAYFEEHWRGMVPVRLWRVLEDKYRGCEPSPSDFRHIEFFTTPMTRRMSVAGLVGFQRSTSIHTAYAAAHGEAAAEAVLRSYRADLLQALGTDDDSAEVEWAATLAAILAREPVPLQGQASAHGG